MAEWRFRRGWSDEELEARLNRLDRLDRNFAAPPEELSLAEGWSRYCSEAALATEPPGDPLPDRAFQRARIGIENYEFSDPGIVTAHFDPLLPLLGRRMLLEIRVLGLRYLCGVVVGAVRAEQDEAVSTFGFRYDTLQDHIERGSEWFVLTKSRETGEVRYRIEAFWRPGDFPNWWSRMGFRILSPVYQRRWHHRAQHRLACLARYGSTTPPVAEHGRLVHEGPAVIFEANRAYAGTTRRISARAAGGEAEPARRPETAWVLAAAAAAGAAAGLRSLTPPAVIARRWTQLEREPRDPGEAARAASSCSTPETTGSALVRSLATGRVLGWAATAELIADKLPFVPDRIRPLPFLGRAAVGAGCGAWLAQRLGRSVLAGAAGAAVGALAAMAAARAGYRARTVLSKRASLPDWAPALVEDALALGLSRWAARGFSPPPWSRTRWPNR